ncbi:hypothetical protein PVAP13_5KG475800 [Panicum virgatum]|uniref:No apical meristem-associated C-terminal domain-containing protein n=1 Tax=Panicum virgatum TaxID=38727 RepID=A0A8T0SMJ8_PANVG|nr:hypothetical protein PVAP13_5KG475800 [Panicum virgatum]
MPEDLVNTEHIDVNDGCNDGTQAGYFTDLLVNDLEETQVAQPTSDPTIDDGPAAAKCSQGRSKNFSTEEDCLLVSAWLNVGMDPIQGVDQSQGTYWGRIYDYFHANKTFESTRTTISLMNRWSGIQHDVNLFCGCVTWIQDRNRSGSRVDDKIAEACALFKSEDRKNRKFTLMHCWNILKDMPKWMERRKEITCAKKNKQQETEGNGHFKSCIRRTCCPGCRWFGCSTIRKTGWKEEREKEAKAG